VIMVAAGVGGKLAVNPVDTDIQLARTLSSGVVSIVLGLVGCYVLRLGWQVITGPLCLHHPRTPPWLAWIAGWPRSLLQGSSSLGRCKLFPASRRSSCWSGRMSLEPRR
jgi:hypothetical protein